MPPSALEQLTRLNIEYPMIFKLTNKKTKRITHCGVLEFVADEGKVYLPHWVCIILSIYATHNSPTLPDPGVKIWIDNLCKM